MSAATHRSTPAGEVIGRPERLTPTQALAGYLNRGLCGIGVAQATPITHGVQESRRVAAGCQADLVLLRVPLARALAAPSADLVAATLIGGSIVPTA
jgi:hypothetical protein